MNKDDMFENKTIESYELFLNEIKENCYSQANALKSKLKEHIKIEEEYKFMCGMVDTMIYMLVNYTKTETELTKTVPMMKNLGNMIACSMKAIVDVAISGSSLESKLPRMEE
jgi:hypothetical protein